MISADRMPGAGQYQYASGFDGPFSMAAPLAGNRGGGGGGVIGGGGMTGGPPVGGLGGGFGGGFGQEPISPMQQPGGMQANLAALYAAMQQRQGPFAGGQFGMPQPPPFMPPQGGFQPPMIPHGMGMPQGMGQQMPQMGRPPMGQFGMPHPMQMPQQQGGYDSSGINPHGMYSGTFNQPQMPGGMALRNLGFGGR